MGFVDYRFTAVITVTITFTVLSIVQGVPWFTREPPSVVYVSSGDTARLVWGYNVENRTAIYDPFSPEWWYVSRSGGRARIGVDDGNDGWKFVIQKECPPRLRNRVSKESTATLVISNVTTADSGIYECTLLFLLGNPVRSRVQLTVTDRPRFTDPVNSTTPVIEGSSLCIQCSAKANPLPNVTWVRIRERPIFISEGIGKVLLRFNNITRHESGTYECQARNNPNGDPVTMRTEISVQFPVEPANVSVSDIKVTSAVIKWLSPLDGGGPVIEYKIQIDTIPPGETLIIQNTYYVIKNLINNTTYKVKVYARNAVGYGKAAIIEFTTKERNIQGPFATTTSPVKEVYAKIETIERVGVPAPRTFAGVIGVIIWIGLMSTAVLLVTLKKRFSEKGREERNLRRKCNKDVTDTYDMTDMPSCTENDESKQNKEDQPVQVIPVYAEVDKSKKRRPGEIVYAKLEKLPTSEDASKLALNPRPPIYHETEYADIRH